MITLKPYVVIRVLVGLAIVLIIASTGGQLVKYIYGHDYVRGLVPLFYLDAEQNIPTFYSVLLMFFASVLLAVIAMLNSDKIKSHFSKWVILSIGFLFMAYDEAFQVHEQIVSPVKSIFFTDGNLGMFFYAWVIPGIALIIGLGLLFLRFLLYLSATTRRNFLIAAALYLSGAIGFELIGGNYHEIYGNQNLIYCMLVTVEESLEMAGVIFFIWALLTYLADNHKEVQISFGRVHSLDSNIH